MNLRPLSLAFLLFFSLGQPLWAIEPAQEFTYEDLVQLIQSKGLTQLESVLPLLPEEFRSHYTLMYQSRSLQGASYQNPRAILFGENAKLTCAFNGDASQKGFDVLECFQFRSDTSTFEFRQIRFPTIENGLQAVQFSKPNLSADGSISCTACHSTDPRPNWDHYSTWVGAYGFEDDDLGDDATNYASFANLRTTHPRYQWLIQGPYATDPYSDLAEGRIDFYHRPNLDFSEAVGKLNSLRAKRILENKVERFQSLAFAVSALGCALNSSQISKLTQANPGYAADLDLGSLFAKVGISQHDWSTQIFQDSPTYSDQPWEHQAGTSYLSADISMGIIQELAGAGDTDLQRSLVTLQNYYPTRYSGPNLQFFETIESIVPDADIFGGSYQDHLNLFCPKLTDVFVNEYLSSRKNLEP